LVPVVVSSFHGREVGTRGWTLAGGRRRQFNETLPVRSLAVSGEMQGSRFRREPHRLRLFLRYLCPLPSSFQRERKHLK
jgi:hypothetical protein